jgi:Mn2+/Fe2+ NRAMP family transporter
MGWTLLFSYPLMSAIQRISAQIGRVTGKGIAGNLRSSYPRSALYGLVGLLPLANTINQGADLGAMGAALQLLVGGPQLAYAALFGIASVLLEVFARYSRYVALLKWMSLSLFAYVATVLVVDVSWRDKAFYGTIAGATLMGGLLNFTPLDPIKALFWSAVINGVVAVPVMIVIMLMASKPSIMGRLVISPGLRIMGWLSTAVMATAAVGMFATWGD